MPTHGCLGGLVGGDGHLGEGEDGEEPSLVGSVVSHHVWEG